MSMIKLRRILGKKQAANLLQDIADSLGGPVSVYDEKGVLVFGPKNNQGVEAPLVIHGEQVGSVRAEVTAAAVATSALSCFVSQELEKTLLSNETLVKYNELTILYEITPFLAQMQDPKAACKQVLEWCLSLVECQAAGVLLAKPGSGSPPDLLAMEGDAKLAKAVAANAGTLIRDVMQNAVAELVNDCSEDYRFSDADETPGAMLCAPLLAQGEILGVMLLAHREPQEYMARDIKVLGCIAAQTGLALQNERRGRRLEKLAALLKPGQQAGRGAGE